MGSLFEAIERFPVDETREDMLKEPTNELPINYNSGELLVGVLPVLDLR
jgi:hypothetical protein